MQSPLQSGPITLTLWVRIHSWRSKLDITLYDKVYQQLAAGQWFSPVSSTNKTDRHDMSDVLLKMALNTINRTQNRLHGRTRNGNAIIFFTCPIVLWRFAFVSVQVLCYQNIRYAAISNSATTLLYQVCLRFTLLNDSCNCLAMILICCPR
jgi:hypothetical protein